MGYRHVYDLFRTMRALDSAIDTHGLNSVLSDPGGYLGLQFSGHDEDQPNDEVAAAAIEVVQRAADYAEPTNHRVGDIIAVAGQLYRIHEVASEGYWLAPIPSFVRKLAGHPEG